MKNRSNIFKAMSIWRLLEDISIKRKIWIQELCQCWNTTLSLCLEHFTCYAQSQAEQVKGSVNLSSSGLPLSSRTLITHSAVCYNAGAWHWTLWHWYHFLPSSAATYRGIWRYKSAQDDTQTASQDLNIEYHEKTCRVKLHQWVVITCVNITPSSLPALTTNSNISANTHLI